MKNHGHMPSVHCPHCGQLNDGYTDAKASGAQPHEGAASICVYCVLPSIFTKVDDTLALRLPTPVEQASLDADEYFQHATNAVLNAKLSGQL